MRLFIAIDFNGLKDTFIGLQSQLPGDAKLNLVKSFHLTLKFLGDVQHDKVDEIISILSEIRLEKFMVSLGTIGIFPTENYIKIVWVGLKPEERIIELRKQIDNSLKSLFGEEKDFKAHITLARVKSPENKKSFVEEIKNIKVENKIMEVNNFRLVKSTLSPQGPVYGELEEFNSCQ